MAVRVDVAYLLGGRHPLAHMNSSCFGVGFTQQAIKKGPDGGKTPHKVWVDKYDKAVQRAKREPFVAHHLEKYGALPIWVAIELWDFGMLSRLFSGMRDADKYGVAAKYGANSGVAFAQWLHSLNCVRNICAHHSRLWNVRIPKMAPSPQGWHKYLSNTRPFFYFCLMQHLLRIISPGSDWHLRFKALLAQDFPAGQFSFGDFGLLPGWESLPLWR